jgi:hypothetical protein
VRVTANFGDRARIALATGEIVGAAFTAASFGYRCLSNARSAHQMRHPSPMEMDYIE